jgi:hypothetical protein
MSWLLSCLTSTSGFQSKSLAQARLCKEINERFHHHLFPSAHASRALAMPPSSANPAERSKYAIGYGPVRVLSCGRDIPHVSEVPVTWRPFWSPNTHKQTVSERSVGPRHCLARRRGEGAYLCARPRAVLETVTACILSARNTFAVVDSILGYTGEPC